MGEAKHKANTNTTNQNPKTQTQSKQKTKATTKDPPSMLVVFPLYGCETGEKMNCKISKGLNSPRKAKCIWSWVVARNGQSSVASLLARMKSPKPL